MSHEETRKVTALLVFSNGNWSTVAVDAEDPGTDFLDIAGTVVREPLFQAFAMHNLMVFCLETDGEGMEENHTAEAVLGISDPLYGPFLFVKVDDNCEHVDIEEELVKSMERNWREKMYEESDVPRLSTRGD